MGQRQRGSKDLAGKFLSRLAELGLHLLWPVHCPLCGMVATPACRQCLLGLSEKGSSLPFCSECMGSYPCDKHKGSFPLWSFSRFTGPSRDLVHILKYGSRKCLGRPMGRSMGEVLPRAGGAILVPVPLHKGSSRAFNQSCEIARGVAEVWRAEVAEYLSWKSPRPSQVGLPSGKRRSLPGDAMEWKGRSCPGRPVILVDDVCTTGATLRSAALALKSAGASVGGAIVWAMARGGTVIP